MPNWSLHNPKDQQPWIHIAHIYTEQNKTYMKLFHFQMIGGGDFMTNIVRHFLLVYLAEYSPLTRPPSLDVE